MTLEISARVRIRMQFYISPLQRDLFLYPHLLLLPNPQITSHAPPPPQTHTLIIVPHPRVGGCNTLSLANLLAHGMEMGALN